MNRNFLYLFLLLIIFSACNKSDSTGAIVSKPDSLNLIYGDSIFYVKEGDLDNIVMPQANLKGKFSGFPEGIELDELTGAINVDKSETGLRYRITFIPDDHSQDTLTSVVLLSGISYLDKIYYMDQGEDKAYPIYNASLANWYPGYVNEFDVGGGCNSEGVAVNTKDGSIDLKKTIVNGVFGDVPKNGAQKEVELRYKLDDESNQALNKLKVKLYYFETANDITHDLVAEMNERRNENMFIGLEDQPPFLSVYNPHNTGLMVASNGTLGTAKPRPPCVFLVGRSLN